VTDVRGAPPVVPFRPRWIHEHAFEALIVCGILVVTGLTRFWDLNRVGFRGDEAVYAGQAAVLAGDRGLSPFFVMASRGNSNFLLYQEIVSLVYRVLGVDDVAARVVSAVFSVLTVLVVYLIARTLYGRRAAAFAAAMLAVSSYAANLGRLALLDSTVTFFVSLAILFLVLWQRSPRLGWLCAFVAASALASQAKVIAILLVFVAAAVLALSGSFRRLTVRSVAAAALVGLVALTPAIVQLVRQAGMITGFLGTSLGRHSPVSGAYYWTIIVGKEGLLATCVVGVGLLLAAVRSRREDLVPWCWLLVFAGFFLLYPLKAFNYILPLAPAIAILAGRGLAGIPLPRVPPLAVAACCAVLGGFLAASHLLSTIHDDSSAGVREAAYWLRANTPPNAGVMTLSQGSAQYVFPFYAQRDGFPYGRFRLDTVLAGRKVILSKPTPPGKLPLDWISYWPPRLIQSGQVSYLVYATNALDDPSEQDQIGATMTHRQFRSLIENYGGVLVHTVTWQHQSRVFIYRVTKRLHRPVVSFRTDNGQVRLTGQGFDQAAPVTVTYNGAAIAHSRADNVGDVVLLLPVPTRTQVPYHLVVTDAAGNSASVIGLPAAKLTYVTSAGRLAITGQHFTPKQQVTVYYHNAAIGHATADAQGSFTLQVPVPNRTRLRYKLRAIDSSGHSGWVVGVEGAAVQYRVANGSVQVTGQHFQPNSIVTISYHARFVTRVGTNAAGSFTAAFRLPSPNAPGYRLIVVDPAGHRATAQGLH
jgi:Dolichyl-phosphate-mannose-protein mannosyltransferase